MVADKIFDNDVEYNVSWGRVVALFTWAAMLCERFAKMKQPQMVTTVGYWLAAYTDCNLKRWMENNYIRLIDLSDNYL